VEVGIEVGNSVGFLVGLGLRGTVKNNGLDVVGQEVTGVSNGCNDGCDDGTRIGCFEGWRVGVGEG
jgi:hypothetical protein